MIRHTLVTLSVAGPCDTWPAPWLWTVDGPGNIAQGFVASEGAAWGAARHAAVGALGRLEAPNGGDELRAALGGDQ